MLKCVKKDGNYVSPEELRSVNHISHIYIPGEETSALIGHYPNAEIISDESVFFSDLHEHFADVIKKAFNPLLKVQNMLFMTENGRIVFEVPHLYAQAVDNEKALSGIIDEAPDSAFMEGLINYSITKDLYFMNLLTEKSFDPNAFKLCDAFVAEPENSHIKQSLLNAVSCGGYQNDVLIAHNQNEATFKRKITEAIDREQSQKNVLFIHLESISQLIFNANKHLMPAVNEAFGKSVNFSRYYSSATSTLMAVSAIFHGNDFELDRFSSYDDIILNNCHSENIFKILRKNGYETKPFIYTNPALSKEFLDAAVYDDGVSQDGRIFDYDKFLSEIEEFLESNKNGRFAAFIDYEPTHCGVNDEETAKIPIFEQKSKYAYIALDNVVKYVWDCLREKGLIDKTLVVFYGDHGDDKWTRCINNGFSHMTEPYLSSIHCPLAIYDSRLDYGYLDGIVSGIDIKPTVLNMLGIDNPDSFPYSGVNAFAHENACAYSSALFVNQSETEKIGSFEMAKLNGFCSVETKNKSFCVVDDNYCLIVGKDGVQMFNTHSDPLSYNNLLNFYELDESGNAVMFNNYGAWRGHFRLEIMADAQVYECLRGFYGLREKLIKRIEERSGYVDNIVNPFDFKRFGNIRGRGFIV